MDSTGSTFSKNDKKDISISKDHFKYFPSIQEQGLGEPNNRKKLQALFEKYLKPAQNESKTLDI